jgi:hypothetical protein
VSLVYVEKGCSSWEYAMIVATLLSSLLRSALVEICVTHRYATWKLYKVSFSSLERSAFACPPHRLVFLSWRSRKSLWSTPSKCSTVANSPASFFSFRNAGHHQSSRRPISYPFFALFSRSLLIMPSIASISSASTAPPGRCSSGICSTALSNPG